MKAVKNQKHKAKYYPIKLDRVDVVVWIDDGAGWVIPLNQFHYVVMVCDEKQTDCPFFPGGKEYIHHAFDDPAACTGTDEEVLACFRKTRDEIKTWIEATLVAPPDREPG